MVVYLCMWYICVLVKCERCLDLILQVNWVCIMRRCMKYYSKHEKNLNIGFSFAFIWTLLNSITYFLTGQKWTSDTCLNITKKTPHLKHSRNHCNICNIYAIYARGICPPNIAKKQSKLNQFWSHWLIQVKDKGNSNSKFQPSNNTGNILGWFAG